jgi:hypothetical protein
MSWKQIPSYLQFIYSHFAFIFWGSHHVGTVDFGVMGVDFFA